MAHSCFQWIIYLSVHYNHRTGFAKLMSDDTFELELDAMAHGGSALGRYEGRTVFVPYTIPGERIRARITQDKGRIAFAEGVTLLEASADRVPPRCPHFGPGRCGRCQWQHIDYPAQLLLKQDVLADQLERIGGFRDPVVRPVIASPAAWGYDQQLTLMRGADGVFGLSSAGGRIIPVNECAVTQPEVLDLRDLLDLEDIPNIQAITLQIGSDGAPSVILRLTDEDAPELAADIAASVNLILGDHEPVNLIGDSHVCYTVRERAFRVTAGSFFRPNVAQIPNLVDVVLAALNLTGQEAVLDGYAGVGVFSAFVAPHARRVTLIESYPPAVTDADANLADFDHLDIIEGAVEAVLPELDEPYHAAVIDPPGDGLSTAALDSLVSLAIPRLIYVSSDPATLARDGKRLASQGYRLVYAQPLDFAPQTYYLDTVAVFERGR
jgi:23S rRNA (uracil1939-C5)-methyltransferase